MKGFFNMKKLFLLLFFTFITYANAQNAQNAQNTQTSTHSFPIDEKATAIAPWKVGETVATINQHVVASDLSSKDTELPGYRVFLGITTDNYFLVQDFYENGNKYSDPYQLIRQSAVLNNSPDWHTALHGALVTYYPTGEKMVDKYSIQGHFAKETNIWYPSGQLFQQMRYIRTGNLFTIYYPNGQKNLERQYNPKGQVIQMQEWDENGNLK